MKRDVRSVALHSLLLVVLIAALAADSSAQTEWFGKNKVQYKDFRWNVLKTPHFDIHFTDGYRDLAARTGVILEYGYRKLSNDFSHQIPWRIPVVIYGSHSDFQQTNVTWSLIPEGVQAFAEPLRKRMVLHFSGSNSDYSHTAIHELVHIFSFDIIYGTLLRSVFSRNLLFPIPLWFMEGVAEYYSAGYDRTGEMFMRDAAVFDYLMDLDYTGGYMAYKSGQAAIYYLNETYGPGKVIEIMDNLRNQRGSINMALQGSLGISSEELSRDWKKAMRRRYWPLYADKKEAESYGRRLTDHMKKHHYMNVKPVFSPDGEYIVFFSDLKGLDGIYLMNALTGKIEKRLIAGQMSTRFESIRSMNSSLTYSPDGTRVAFVAKSDGFDKLFIMEVPGGSIREEIAIDLDFFHSPSWSPSGARIAVVGVEDGRTDLYLYDLEARKLTKITDTAEDEDNPAWFPDGTRLAYSRYPVAALQPYFEPDSAGVDKLAGVDFTGVDNVRAVDSDIWSVDVETGAEELLIRTSGNDNSPVIFEEGREILFTSDENGISNLYRGSIEVGSYSRFTDVLGGIFSPAYSPAKNRLVYSAFNSAGYDLFIMDEFSEKSKSSYSTGSPLLAEMAEEEGGGGAAAADSAAAAADSLKAASGVAELRGLDTERPDIRVTGSAEAAGVHRAEPPTIDDARLPYGDKEFPSIVVNEDSKEDINPDTLEAIRKRLAREIGTVQRYHVKLAPDYVGDMGVMFSTGFGFGLLNQIAFSDLLGDHHLFLSFNFYRSIEDSDFLVQYYYLKKRIDYAAGVFQFKNYLSSRVSSIGESFIDYRLFTERNYGVFGLASYPFSMFTRLDLEFEGFVSQREFFGEYRESEQGYTFYVPEKSQRYLLQPTLSIIHDSAYFGSFGPVIGSRWMASVSRALSVSGSGISRTTGFFDYRKYIPLFYRNYFAFRGVGAVSEGDDPKIFFLGGPLTMRGYDYLQFSGSRTMLFNAEYRYPLVDQIIFGWPGRWGFQYIGGTFFFDSGAVWGEGRYVEPLASLVGPRVVQLPEWLDSRKEHIEFYSDFGMGFYVRFGFLILNFQLAWPTDFSTTGQPMFHFFIGPMF